MPETWYDYADSDGKRGNCPQSFDTATKDIKNYKGKI
jgi:hypothetical protein